MKSYVILDTELKTISMLNTWATLFFSLGMSFASIAVGFWSNFFITDTPSKVAEQYGYTITRVFAGIAVMCFALTVGAVCSRRSEVNYIKRESGE